MTSAEVRVQNNPEKNRYEVFEDGQLAGFAEYMLTDGLITFTHTEVDPAFEGKGLASQLVQFAMDDVRATGERQVLPVCPYVTVWLTRHPDYLDIVYNRAK